MGGISVCSQSLQMGSLRLRVQHIKRRLQSDAERLTSPRLATMRLIETNWGQRRREHWTLTLHRVGTVWMCVEQQLWSSCCSVCLCECLCAFLWTYVRFVLQLWRSGWWPSGVNICICIFICVYVCFNSCSVCLPLQYMWVFMCLSVNVYPNVCRLSCLSTKAAMWLGRRSKCEVSKQKMCCLGWDSGV